MFDILLLSEDIKNADTLFKKIRSIYRVLKKINILKNTIINKEFIKLEDAYNFGVLCDMYLKGQYIETESNVLWIEYYKSEYTDIKELVEYMYNNNIELKCSMKIIILDSNGRNELECRAEYEQTADIVYHNSTIIKEKIKKDTKYYPIMRMIIECYIDLLRSTLIRSIYHEK